MNRLVFLTVFAISALCAQAGHAAATEVENITDPTWHPYQVYASTNCASAGACTVEFPAITTTRTLVTHASCRFSMSTAYGYVNYAELNHGPVEPLANAFNNLPLFTFSSKDSVASYGINTETYLFFDNGTVPAIVIYTSDANAGGVSCTLTGYYKG